MFTFFQPVVHVYMSSSIIICTGYTIYVSSIMLLVCPCIAELLYKKKKKKKLHKLIIEKTKQNKTNKKMDLNRRLYAPKRISYA